mmetsp:Transcript_9298/g.13473  ORF Transcript_9298/g.13473 Transcript_9298/m.13473 type:complete len:195 (+) Transcript_9298:732-1316(+)
MQQADGLSYEEDSRDDGHKIIRRLMTPAYPAAATTPVLLQQSHSSNSNQEASNNRAISVSYATAAATPAHHSTLYSHAQSILDSPESIEARTCCASILNVFHEHCDRNEEIEYTDRSLFVIVSVICILVGVVLGSIIEKVPNIHHSFDGSVFLRVMLPFIVFHAALSIDKHALYMHVWYAARGALYIWCTHIIY